MFKIPFIFIMEPYISADNFNPKETVSRITGLI